MGMVKVTYFLETNNEICFKIDWRPVLDFDLGKTFNILSSVSLSLKGGIVLPGILASTVLL